jgi:hypothetical protein
MTRDEKQKAVEGQTRGTNLAAQSWHLLLASGLRRGEWLLFVAPWSWCSWPTKQPALSQSGCGTALLEQLLRSGLPRPSSFSLSHHLPPANT